MNNISGEAGFGPGHRNDRGQWVPGTSGNRSGRPRKKPVLPKGLKHDLADAMTEEILVTDAEGKQKMVPAYAAASRRLVRSLQDITAREFMTAMQWMDKLGVFDEMRRRAGNEPKELTLEQARERLIAKMKTLGLIADPQ